MRRHIGSVHCRFYCVQVRFLLELTNVLLVPNSLVAKPIRDLRDGDPALLGQLLLGFLAGIRVGQVRVEVLVQHLRRLFVEVAPLASGVQEA